MKNNAKPRPSFLGVSAFSLVFFLLVISLVCDPSGHREDPNPPNCPKVVRVGCTPKRSYGNTAF